VDRHEPYRLADAEIAQQVQNLTRVVDRLAEEVEILSQAVKAIGAEQGND
jgi:outer membrane murein-binding lipoprotein Lpp